MSAPETETKERYEIDDLLKNEGRETQHLLVISGVVVVVVLLALALLFSVAKGKDYLIGIFS